MINSPQKSMVDEPNTVYREESEYGSEYESEVDNDFIRSEYFKSDGFDYMESQIDKNLRQRKLKKLNSHLLGYQREIYMGILFDDADKQQIAGVQDIKDINFMLEVSKGHYYTPLMFAAVKGSWRSLQILVRNLSIELDIVDQETGVNAFWLAAYYGRGKCLSILGSSGSDMMHQHKITNANALHIAIIKGHFDVVRQLILSNYPVNEVMNGGMTPLILIAKYPKQVNLARLIIKSGADVNYTCD